MWRVILTYVPKYQIQQKSCIIYWYRCNRLDCVKEYIGKSATAFGERFKEHLITHIWPPIHHRPPNHIGQLQHCGQGWEKLCQNN